MFVLITPQMKSLEEGYKYLESESTFVVLRVLPVLSSYITTRSTLRLKIHNVWQLTGSALLKGWK